MAMLLSLLGCWWVKCCDAAEALRRTGGLGRQKGPIVGWGNPEWFGSSYSESPAAVNPFASDSSTRLDHLIGDQFPVAPFDRVDRSDWGTAAGVVPYAPNGVKESSRAPVANDFVDKYSHPDTFPGERRPQAAMDLDKPPVIPLDEREIVASHDSLRTPIGTVTVRGYRFSIDPNPLDNYPLVAPGDILPGGPKPIAHHDEIPERVARFIHQVYDKKARYDVVAHQKKGYKSVDLDNDTMISYEEYIAEVVGRQNKTELEAKRLWDRYHTTDSEAMTKEDFNRLERTGFSVGSLRRTDVANVLDPAPQAVSVGFWGSGAECPNGTFVNGARLKVMATTRHADNTGLNRIGLRCTDGSEVDSIEGPDGEWTQWADCPPGQRVYAVRVRSAPLTLRTGRDNSGLNGMEFVCRATSMSSFTRLRFGDGLMAKPGIVVAPGPVAVGGGWSKETRCGLNQAVCGLQANVERDQGAGDDKGIVDLRVYCCIAPIVCDDICAGENARTVKCLVCKQAAAESSPLSMHSKMRPQHEVEIR